MTKFAAGGQEYCRGRKNRWSNRSRAVLSCGRKRSPTTNLPSPRSCRPPSSTSCLRHGRLLTKLKPNHRSVQVSPRTLLVLVTVLCIALSMWVLPAERQRRAVAAIKLIGGEVGYAGVGRDKTRATTPPYLSQWRSTEGCDLTAVGGAFHVLRLNRQQEQKPNRPNHEPRVEQHQRPKMGMP